MRDAGFVPPRRQGDDAIMITSTPNEAGNQITIRVTGRFDFTTQNDFLATFRDQPKGELFFLVDMRESDYIDSTALGLLLQLREHSNQRRRVRLLNCNAKLEEMLKVARFDQLFDIG